MDRPVQNGREKRILRWLRIKQGLPADVRMRLRTFVFGHRPLMRLWMTADPVSRYLVAARDTRIVIDGFPRCANTYAQAAFALANPDAPVISHLHSPASIVVAARRKLPMILLIRDPEEAVPSLLQMLEFFKPVRARTAIRNYIRYYEIALDHIDGVVVGDFKDVTTNFPAIVEACNDRFGTRFKALDPNPETERQIQESIAQTWSGTRESRVPPSRSAADILATFTAADHAEMERAKRLYATVLERSRQPA